MRRRWVTIAADVLAAQSADEGYAILAGALVRHLGGREAVRLSVGPQGHVAWRFLGPGPPPSIELPSADDIRRHPLHRFHTETGELAPSLMADAMRSGRSLHPESRALLERLQLTVHQVSLPLGPLSSGFDGWMVVSDYPIPPRSVENLADVHALIRGLDQHLRLLGEALEDTPALTPRERVILTMVAAGSTVQGMAAKLLISPRTVHKHQENLYRKLGAVDRLSAVLRAQEAGLLTVQDRLAGLWRAQLGSSPAHSSRSIDSVTVRSSKSASER